MYIHLSYETEVTSVALEIRGKWREHGLWSQADLRVAQDAVFFIRCALWLKLLQDESGYNNFIREMTIVIIST